MKTKFVIVVLLIGILFTACSASSQIVGKWASEDGIEYEFFKDGTMTINTFGIVASGSYEFIDKDTIKMRLDGLWGIGGATICDVKVSGKELSLTIAGQMFTLEKVK